MRNASALILATLAVFTLSACTLGVDDGDDNSITVYSDRHYDSDEALYDDFEEETGISVNLVSGEADQLINRLENEGEDTEADVLIIADAGRLHRAKGADVLGSVESEPLNSNIPENYRDPEGMWFGLTRRARILVYHPDRVDEDELSTYEALADAEWEDRVVTRSSSNIYNQSLVASFIEVSGENDTRTYLEGLVDNFARTPAGNDRDQAKAVMEGEGDVAIMNTYYMGRMAHSSDEYEQDVAESLEVFFPNQDTTGTHINVSGGGVTKHSDSTEDAVRFLEYLSGEEAQASYANANYEYPVNPNVEPHELLQSWGDFTAQDINLSDLGEHSGAAAILMDEVGWE